MEPVLKYSMSSRIQASGLVVGARVTVASFCVHRERCAALLSFLCREAHRPEKINGESGVRQRFAPRLAGCHLQHE